jgi:hypothetical protein
MFWLHKAHFDNFLNVMIPFPSLPCLLYVFNHHHAITTRKAFQRKNYHLKPQVAVEKTHQRMPEWRWVMRWGQDVMVVIMKNLITAIPLVATVEANLVVSASLLVNS